MKDIRFKKGFTLIELLVVVAIISLLSSIVMASLNSARAKSTDAFLKEEGLQIRTLLEQQYNDTGSYAGLQPLLWTYGPADCDSYFTGNYVTQARNICKAIANKASVTWLDGYKMFLGTTTGAPDKCSIMIALPGKNTFFCLGSSGASSDVDTGSSWTSPGCYYNP